MNFVEISHSNILNEVERYLRDKHNKSDIVFSKASPYGQILSVVEQLHQLSFLYLKNSLNNFDLSDKNSNNEKVIKASAILAGHIPSRAISATGTLKLSVKSGVDLSKELPSLRLTFGHKLSGKLKNKTNNLFYSILGDNNTTYTIDKNTKIYLPIIQGEFKVARLTGTGEPNQTFQIIERNQIENGNITISVNGENWELKNSLYDMSPNEKSVIVRTGYEGGLDVIFGNGNFGMKPPISSLIEITYLLSNGSNGNIFRRTVNDFTFVDEPIDDMNSSIDASKIFDIVIFNDINFGANSESVQFTKNMLPIASNNFVLALPSQYVYHIKKLGVFSYVNAFNNINDESIYIMATPNINLFKNNNSDYFSVNKSAFLLDKLEKEKIENYLRSSGNIQLTKKFTVNSPILSHYIMNIFIIRYNDSNDDNIKSQILDRVSNYFLNIPHLNRIPKSDLITLLSEIKDIHSVDIQFISKKNEDYHRENKISMENGSLINYDSDTVIGLDPILGDIIFEANEIPIIRGGWYDRNGTYFSPNINAPNLKSLNIIRRGVIDK